MKALNFVVLDEIMMETIVSTLLYVGPKAYVAKGKRVLKPLIANHTNVTF